MKNNVIDFTKFMNKEGKRRLEKDLNLPKVYSIRLEVSEVDGTYHLEYDVSNKQLLKSLLGKEMMFEHLIMVLLDVCSDDPAMIVELQESLEDYFFKEDGQE